MVKFAMILQVKFTAKANFTRAKRHHRRLAPYTGFLRGRPRLRLTGSSAAGSADS